MRAAPIFSFYLTDFSFERVLQLNGQIFHTDQIFVQKLHFLKGPSFFAEVQSWPDTPQLAKLLFQQSLAPSVRVT